MNNFTFNDSGGNQVRRTSRWYGLLSFCMLFLALLFLPIQMKGQEYVPLLVSSGFTDDVIAETSPASGSTTNSVDAFGNGNFGNGDNAFVVNGYPGAGATSGFPVNGLLTSVTTTGLQFQLGAYDEDNSLRLASAASGAGESGTLVFTNQVAALNIYVLATGGSGACTFTGTITFTDNTTQAITSQTVADWYNGTPVVHYLNGRIHRGTNQWETATNNPRVYQVAIAIATANQTKQIESISFTNTQPNAGRFLNIFGVSAEIVPDCPMPTDLAASVTGTDVELSWSSLGDSFEVEWGTSGFTLGNGTSATGLIINSHSLSGLATGAYDFYVRQDCGADGFSNWAGPFSFGIGFYGGGDIPTLFATPTSSSDVACTPDATMTIVVPAGYQIANINVQYDMTAWGGAWMSEQRSALWSPTLNLGETTIAAGAGGTAGTFSYDRNTSFANGATGSVDFVLKAWRTWQGGGTCNTDYNYVVNNTWIITPTFELIPDCPSPIGLNVNNITAGSADLTWISSGASFDIEYGITGFTPTGNPNDASTTGVGNPYTLSGLNQTTTYQYYVRQDCGTDGVSAWTGPFTFTTECDTFLLPFQEQFSSGVLPNCWANTSSNPVANGLWKFAGAADYGAATAINGKPAGTYAWVDGSDPTNMNDVTLTSPPIDVSSLTVPFISFEYFSNNEQAATYPNNVFTVQVSDGTGWTTVFTDNTNDPQWREIELPLPTFTGTTLQVRFIVDKTIAPTGYAFYNDILLDNVIVAEAPTCTKPASLTAVPTSLTSVTLGWTSTGTLFDVEWGPTGFTVGTGTQIYGLTTNSTSVTTVIDTPYQFYVRQDCGTDGVSLWTGPFSFQTGYCTPAYLYGCAGGAKISNFETTDAIINIANNTGTATCGANGYNNFTSMAVSTIESGTVSFNVGVGSYAGGVKVWVDWNNNGVFDTDELMSASAATIAVGGTYSGTITVPLGTALGDYRMRVRVVEGSTTFDACSLYNYGETEDYTVTIITPPACLPPTALGFSSVSATEAMLNWTSAGNNFDVEYGFSGFTLGNGTQITDIPTNSTLIPVVIDTAYQFYVRQNCGVDGVSVWVGPFSFYTGYCAVTSTSTAYGISNFVTTGGIVNINNASTGGSYSNYTAQSVAQFEGGADVQFTITSANGTAGMRIWIDWNNDFDFNDPGELVYSSGAYVNPGTGTITIPVGTPVGDYRMRVVANWLSTTPSACGDLGNALYGEAEDYTFSVIVPPTCMPPTGLSATPTSLTSVTLGWTSTGSLFDLEWGPAGFTVGTGTQIYGLTTNSTSVTTVIDTPYQFYVRQDCSANGDGESLWAGPFSFQTGYCTPAYLYGCSNGSKISNFETTDAIINIANNTGTATCGANGYNNFTSMAVSTIESGTVSFNVGVGSYSGGVKVWIDWNNNGVFETSELMSESAATIAAGGTYSGNITVPLSTALGNYRMRVRVVEGSTTFDACSLYNYGETEDYTVTIITPPACLPPTALGFSSVSATEAMLNWTSAGNNFDVEYGFSGFTLGNGTQITDIPTNSTLIPVVIDTAYQFYVRQNCGVDGVSVWVGPFSFYTGYCAVTSTSTAYGISNFVTTGGIVNINNASTGGSYSNYTAQSVAQFEGGADVQFTITSANGTAGMRIWIDWNNDFDFNDPGELVYSSGAYVNPGTGTITIPVGTPVGDYRMRVVANWLSTTPSACGDLGNALYGEAEDYTFSVIVPPTCMPPTGLSAIPTSLTEVTLGWTSTGSLFDVEWGPTGFTVGTGTQIYGLTTNSTSVTTVIDTPYQFYVRQDCTADDDGYSLWSGPFSFQTGYCVPSSTNAGDHISSFVTTGGIPYNITNTGSGASAGGYGNFTSMSVSHYETGSIDFTLTAGGDPMSVNIWIDWNNNGIFEEDEKVYASGGPGATVTGSFSVPFGTPVGDYRMRVRGQWNNANPAPCGLIAWGEAEDYTLTVIDPPSCLPPFNPMATNISASSVSLSWQSTGDVFDIEWGEQGFVQGTGTLIEGVGNPYVLGGLTGGVAYDFYVRRDCTIDDDGYSMWNGPTTFTPGVFEGNIPTLLNANPQVEDIACATSFAIDVPAGQFLSGLTVSYTMTSSSPALDSHQRSVLYSSTLGMGEPQVVSAPNPQNYPGVVYYERSVDFAYGATGTVEFELKAWRTEGGTGCGTDLVYVEDGTWVLNATFEDIPSCPNPPANLSYTNITADSVDLIWTSDETGTFQVNWGVVGFDDDEDDEGTIVSGIDAFSHTLSGLDSSIQYEFYVRRDCSTEDEEDFGDWVGPVRFNSGHCIPYATQGFYFNTFITTNAVENVTYSYTFVPPLGTGYVDNTDMVITQDAGETFNFTSNYVGGASGLRIWVDWNNDFIFADDEQVYYVASGSGNKSGEITIPVGTPGGDYRMRVRVQSGGTSNPPACGLIAQGEALDFTLKVSCEEVATPTGDETQPFDEGDTLADLDVTGDNLVWYADEDLTIVLDPTTELVHDTTYYVVSTNGVGCQSEYLAVTVEQTSSVSDFNSFGFRYYPNPVSEQLYLSANTPISDVKVINMLGQQVNAPANSDNTNVDMSGLPTGNYLIQVTIEGVSKMLKVVKK